MQQATGSAQSINLPMSNLWHSDRQGHRQHGTDRHIIYRRTHTGKQTCLIILAVTAYSGALKGQSIGHLRYSDNCHGARALSAAGV